MIEYLHVLLIIKRHKLIMYIIFGGWLNHSPIKGARILKIKSTLAMVLIIYAICLVDIFMSVRMKGVSWEKFISAKTATDIPNIRFTYPGSFNKSRSKYSAIVLNIRDTIDLFFNLQLIKFYIHFICIVHFQFFSLLIKYSFIRFWKNKF